MTDSPADMVCTAFLKEGVLEHGADLVLFLTLAKARCAIAPACAVDSNMAKDRDENTGRVEMAIRPDFGTLREVSNQ